MENIDKLFSQRFHSQKPENNYNSGLWNDFEKQLEQEMPAAKTSKRKWWMGWKGLTLFNTILVGVLLFVLLYNNELQITNYKLQKGSASELPITNYQLQTSTEVTELPITNYKLQNSSAVDELTNKPENLKLESNKNVLGLSTDQAGSKSQIASTKSFVSTNKLEALTSETNEIIKPESDETIETHASGLTGLELETTETPQPETINSKVLTIEEPLKQEAVETYTPQLTCLPLRRLSNGRQATHNSQPVKSNIQTSKPKGPQYKLKLPDWLNLNSHPKHPRNKPRKDIPDIVPVPVEGF